MIAPYRELFQRTVVASRLPEGVKLLLLVMSVLGDGDGNGTANQAEIGAAMGCSARSVRRHLATLQKLDWSPVRVASAHRSRVDGRGRASDSWGLELPLLFAMPPNPTYREKQHWLVCHGLALHLAATSDRKPENSDSMAHAWRMLELFGAPVLFNYLAAIKGSGLTCWAECLETGHSKIFLSPLDIGQWLQTGNLPDEPAEQKTRRLTGRWWFFAEAAAEAAE